MSQKPFLDAILGLDPETNAFPDWAQNLAEQVWAEHGGDRPLPTLRWVPPAGDSSHSGGTCWAQHHYIRIVAGTSDTDAAMVVMHELAHALRPPSEHHSRAFWDLAFDLYEAYGPYFGFTLDWAYELERGYKVKATYAAAAKGIPAAVRALHDRKMRRRGRPPCSHDAHGIAAKSLEPMPRPMSGVWDVGKDTFEAYQWFRCKRCDWQGEIYRARLSYHRWNPDTGKLWRDR